MREQIIKAREIIQELLTQATGLVELLNMAEMASENKLYLQREGIRSLQELASGIEIKADEAMTELYRKIEA